ncbi:ABC transporter permease [Blastococcus saxobsidens]|uniref:ABC transporter permease n=1 Tax=Blastococcus saxobsidens TaxID=138336 RepID=A0A6L9W153_9ACTN|nr:ABC transporter permease [Blastococcus saxobsidens]
MRVAEKVTTAPSPQPGTGPVAGRSREGSLRRRALDWVPRLLGIAAILVVLEVCSRTGVLPRESFPPVSEIYGSLLGLVGDPGLWVEIGRTMRGWAVGLLLAAVLAVPLGMLLGASRRAFQMSRLVIEFLRPVPSVALIPLAVLVFGVGQDMKVFLVAFACFWPILFQSIYGVQDVDPVARDTARSYGLPPLARFARIILPSAAPYIATGLRISSAIALILALTAELVVGAPGLGRAIVVSQVSGSITQMYALILATGLLGWLLNTVFIAVERRLLRWHPSHREVAL